MHNTAVRKKRITQHKSAQDTTKPQSLNQRKDKTQSRQRSKRASNCLRTTSGIRSTICMHFSLACWRRESGKLRALFCYRWKSELLVVSSAFGVSSSIFLRLALTSASSLFHVRIAQRKEKGEHWFGAFDLCAILDESRHFWPPNWLTDIRRFCGICACV